MAWHRISPEVSVNVFKMCCISNAVNETDDMSWNVSEEIGNGRSEREEDEGSDCEGGDSDTDW
jgi:hypothetical protein